MKRSLEENLKFYRISQDEYGLMTKKLGREPNDVEWPLFSALWSEHCSYKSSKIHLRKFAYRNISTPDMDGENAGVVDLGHGEKVAFKMESHNHPSYIEPVQGAATGVGGILRDIFTMGARPIMSANYLCFGEVEAPRMKYLMDGVVKGISSYGNCVGVPTVTGQTNFHAKYNKNILVNALNVGYFGPDQPMALSKAAGVGNLVVYVGAKTGRDGVHGASMASASFDEDSDSKKPNVQIGDPFYEKLLIEACLEVLSKNYVVAMQDMGAAGLTSSSFEMASKGNCGLEMDLKKVPLRDSTMTPEEILLSESQERMLLVCEPKNLDKLVQQFKRWSLDAVVLGRVIADRKVILKWGDQILTQIDPNLIVEEAPRYDRPYEKWKPVHKVDEVSIAKPIDTKKFIESLFKTMNLNSFEWVYDQYDQRVGARTAKACESSVAVCRLDHSARGLSLAVGCRPELMELDAELGAKDAVLYPALQMAIKGFTPLAMTDCLNFGNPQKTKIMSEFVVSVESIARLAQELDAPVISGNVSFYNETLEENIVSTPAIGMVGIRDTVEDIAGDTFTQNFDHMYLVSYDYAKCNITVADQTKERKVFSQGTESKTVEFVKKTTELDRFFKKAKIKVNASKTVGFGGVVGTALKMCTDSLGFDLSFNSAGLSDDELYLDRLYSFMIVSPEKPETMLSALQKHYGELNIEAHKIGETIERKIKVRTSEEFELSWFRKQYQKNPLK